jgi:hypothetical protein
LYALALPSAEVSDLDTCRQGLMPLLAFPKMTRLKTSVLRTGPVVHDVSYKRVNNRQNSSATDQTGADRNGTLPMMGVFAIREHVPLDPKEGVR